MISAATKGEKKIHFSQTKNLHVTKTSSARLLQ